jgi:hypothetical protein
MGEVGQRGVNDDNYFLSCLLNMIHTSNQ